MLRKINITILLLVNSFIGFGQEFAKEKTRSHIQVEGTNVFMVPPSLFESSNNFKGFQNPIDQTAMIMILEIPGPFSEVLKGFDPEMLKSQGMEIIRKSEIIVSDLDGLLIDIDQSVNGMKFSKQLVVYGNEKSSTLINGTFLKDSLQLGERIRQSILTTFVDSDLISNPREALNYSLNEESGSLKFNYVIGNGMLFNRDLKIPTESLDKATLLTEKSFDKVEIKNQKLFCISRVKKYPKDFSVIPSKGINEIQIDNLHGFELFAKNNDNENEEMYQVILFDENGGYYLFLGTYLKDSKDAVSDIKSIVNTFKRK